MKTKTLLTNFAGILTAIWVAIPCQETFAQKACTNEYCHEGHCTYCGGDGAHACENSDCVNGQVACSFVGCISGKVNCPICGGPPGLVYCTCGGSGCDSCRGSGHDGYMNCSCDGGIIDCTTCGGDGFINCPICGGDHIVTCAKCNGTGLCQAFAGHHTTGPLWWFSRNVILTDNIPIDYGAVNQGQLKHIAMQAWLEMSNIFAYVTVSNIHALVQTFGNSTNDFAPANIGQIKYVATPFYNALISVQYTNRYPWTETVRDDNDFAHANGGQTKNVFSFDLSFPGDSDGDGLPDLWELKYGLDRNSANGINGATGDPDGDGLNNAGELAAGTSPVKSDTDGDSLTDGFEIRNGFDPLVSGEELMDPDGDGLNNREEQNFGTDPFSDDTDQDMLTDHDEVIHYHTNPLCSDTDGDALLDGDEAYADGTHGDSDGHITAPLNADSDGDGLNDRIERLYGTNPLNADSDEDGLSDDTEVFIWHTDPCCSDTDGDGLNDGSDSDPLTGATGTNQLPTSVESALQSSTNTYGANGVLIHVPTHGWYHAVETNLTLISLGN